MNALKQILILLLLWLIIAIGHFYVVPNTKIPFLIALFDPFVHGLVAFTLFLPFRFRNKINTQLLLLVTLSAILIDIDHAIAVKSFSPTAMVSLSTRPLGHSIAFSLSFGLIISFFHYLKYRKKNVFIFIFYLFSVSLISHIMRDAIGSYNTPWAFPFESFPISDHAYFIAFISLTIIHMINLSKLFKGGFD